eukprot:gb/GFBE01004742.1/.p1 GENE.gb/GFBE01004742.1/~~gb/GFBE01004742.1/.p1  ORF type:complete len:344 (+),score=23.19 gb/GFBE01004742.1/:1-1032(+)
MADASQVFFASLGSLNLLPTRPRPLPGPDSLGDVSCAVTGTACAKQPDSVGRVQCAMAQSLETAAGSDKSRFKGRGASDSYMARPGPTKLLDLDSHQKLQDSIRAARRAPCRDDREAAGDFEGRLTQFMAHRDSYWAAYPPARPHGQSRRMRRPGQWNAGCSGAVYEVSSDGCWVMETFADPADMCFVTSRFVFNLWTFEQLRESDMNPWASLDPPVKQQPYDSWEPDSATTPCSSCALGNRFIADSSPNLHHNVGCHDDSDDEHPFPDYHTGCSKVGFHEIELESLGKLSCKVQVICASRFVDSFDKKGRHWVYVLPTSPTASTVALCCQRAQLPPPATLNI